MSFRAKLTVMELRPSGEGVHATFAAVYDSANVPEDNSYAKYTPSASFSMQVDNPAVIEQLAPGKKFYVDFNEVPS